MSKNILTEIMRNKLKLKSLMILGLYLMLMVVFALVFVRYVDKENLQAIVAHSGKLGMLAYILIETVYVTFTPLLNTFILVTSGYIFGGHMGFFVNFLSSFLGAMLIIFLVRSYGRPLLQRVVSSQLYGRFDLIVEKVGPMTLMIVYLLPFTPDDELTYIIAAGGINWKRFILPIAIGNIGKAAYSYIGDFGTSGIAVALYARIAAFIVGVVIVGIQEHILFPRIFQNMDRKNFPQD